MINSTEILQARYRNGRNPEHDCFTPLFVPKRESKLPVQGKAIDEGVRNEIKALNKEASTFPSLESWR